MYTIFSNRSLSYQPTLEIYALYSRIHGFFFCIANFMSCTKSMGHTSFSGLITLLELLAFPKYPHK